MTRISTRRTAACAHGFDAAVSVGAAASLDLAMHAAQHQRVQLTRREAAILRYLLAQRDRVVSRRELLEQLWHDKPPESRRAIDIHIHRLRHKLGGALGARIETVPHIGYRLSSAPRPAPDSSSASDAEAGSRGA